MKMDVGKNKLDCSDFDGMCVLGLWKHASTLRENVEIGSVCRTSGHNLWCVERSQNTLGDFLSA